MIDSNSMQKKIKRKNFFSNLGIGLLGAAVFSQFPFNYIRKIVSNTPGNIKIKVQINQHAVNRKKIGDKNA